MGGRDLGPKTSMMRDRDDKEHHDPPALYDGTEAELPLEDESNRPDEEIAESKAVDLCDVPEDDYVQDDSEYRGVIDPQPCSPEQASEANKRRP